MASHIPLFLAGSRPPNPGWQRTYDYDKKYEPDPLGAELNPNARVWKVYIDEAEIHDHDMIQGLRETLDVHLVLAALFSAVLTTCVVQTSLDLDPDYAQITAYLMAEQIQLLRSPGNTTAVPPSPLGPDSVTHTNLDVWINGLFYTSLSLSLAAALLSTLAKQWLTSYSSNISGDAENRSLHRQFRLNGFRKWKLKDIIGLMPIILHLSLAVFLVGFALFVYRRHLFLSSIVFIISGFTFFFYTVSTILPAIWYDCPYHNPALSRPAHILVYLASLVQYFFVKLNYKARCFYSERPSHILPELHLERQLPHLLAPHHPKRLVDRLGHIPHAIVDNIAVRKDLVADSLLWLFRESTNPSIKTIVICSVAADISLSSTETNLVLHNSPLYPFISFACDRLFSSPPPDDEDKLSRFLCTIIKRFNYVAPWTTPHPAIPSNIVCRAVEYRRTNVVLALYGSDDVNIDSVDIGGYKKMLKLAACGGHEDLMVLLLEKGASTEAHPDDWIGPLPLWEAISHNHLNIAKLLLGKGANPNPRLFRAYQQWQSLMCPLHHASIIGDLTLLEFLLSHNANPRFPDSKGRIPLHTACAFRQVEAIKILMSLPQPFAIENGNGSRVESRTPLHFLCDGEIAMDSGSDNKFQRIADILLKNKPDILNAQDSRLGKTPLHLASHVGDIDAVTYLVENNANTNLLSRAGEHALHFACEADSVEIVKLLCLGDGRINIDIRDANGNTPLVKLCYRHRQVLSFPDGILDIVKFLITSGADITAANQDEETPLTICQSHTNKDILRCLASQRREREWGN